MDYSSLSQEELLDLWDNPEYIETGGEAWEEDDEREYALKQIKNILIDKYGMKRKDFI